MTDGRRKTLKEKVQAGQARNKAKTETTTTIFDRAGEAAIEAKDKFAAFAKEHPITTVAGGLAIGILVSGLFKRSPTRKVAGKAAKRASKVAALGAELALAYAQQAMEAANEASKASAKRLDGLGDAARSAGKDAAHRASDARDAALAITSEAGKRLGKAIRSRIN
jgi:ElaB/YqjD/DUF883 family membrane-anchored ribosome-binding protein